MPATPESSVADSVADTGPVNHPAWPSGDAGSVAAMTTGAVWANLNCQSSTSKSSSVALLPLKMKKTLCTPVTRVVKLAVTVVQVPADDTGTVSVPTRLAALDVSALSSRISTWPPAFGSTSAARPVAPPEAASPKSTLANEVHSPLLM